MNVPLGIAFKGMHQTNGIEALIREEAARLEKVCDYISSCRVIVETRHEHQEGGSPYRVRIDMTVPPGHELVARREPGQGDMHDAVETVIRDAFDVAVRQLRRLTEQQRGDTKSHPGQQVTAVVRTLFPKKDYGFLRSIDTQEDIYFHRNSVLHHGFDHMAVGVGVRYAAAEGEKGLQATSVQVIDVPRVPRPTASRR